MYEQERNETEEVRRALQERKGRIFEGMRLLIWIFVGSLQVRRGLKLATVSQTKRLILGGLDEKCKSEDSGLDPNLS